MSWSHITAFVFVLPYRELFLRGIEGISFMRSKRCCGRGTFVVGESAFAEGNAFWGVFDQFVFWDKFKGKIQRRGLIGVYGLAGH